MNCLEFKRLALSDPNSNDVSFVEHAEQCPDCLKYVGGVRQMDDDIANSVSVVMPESMTARLQLNEILESDKNPTVVNFVRYAKVASVAAVMFASGFLLKGQMPDNQAPQNIVDNQSLDNSQEIVVKMVNHMEYNAVSPVWDSIHANKTMHSLLAVYDSSVQLQDMPRLQFNKICPVGLEEKALHANLETDNGQVTFAYIKGDSVEEINNHSYKGFMTRVKPVPGGNLLIISRNMDSMEDADEELDSALYWDI